VCVEIRITLQVMSTYPQGTILQSSWQE